MFIGSITAVIAVVFSGLPGSASAAGLPPSPIGPLGVFAAPSAAAAPPVVKPYLSRQDLVPPVIKVDTNTAPTSPGLILLTPKATTNEQMGPMLVDDSGNPLWFDQRGDKIRLVMNAQKQTYRGKPVLMWWEGAFIPLGWGMGTVTIVDDHYRTVAQVGVDNSIDLHAIKITPQNTLIAVSYRTTNTVPGGVSLRPIVENVIREIDIATGKVLWTWSSLDHIPTNESYLRSNELVAWDYLHFNAVDLNADGNIVISGRNTHTVYTIERGTGKILSRMGGKFSDYTVAPDAQFAWQHNVQVTANGDISMFDNEQGATFPPTSPTLPYSRAIVVHVDPATKTVSLVRSVHTPDNLGTGAQGSNQPMPDGHDFVSWGDTGRYSEFDQNNQMIYDAHFTGATVNTFVGNRVDWHGYPTEPPAIAATKTATGGVTAYASWNGSTELRRWQLLTGNDPKHLKVVSEVPRGGFETSLTDAGAATYAAVRALDANGKVLATSPVAQVQAG
ncbi:arylsulfotransferase family protein [Actinokineospora inagensis]|uniref:arylsulfotransferase family protein n=1 Tax=Actinokineospora inagensis TaxID=103730 RepID=UPI000426C3CB|nr:arylsulfotransferase family protein [Actinokineospora inagensis]